MDNNIVKAMMVLGKELPELCKGMDTETFDTTIRTFRDWCSVVASQMLAAHLDVDVNDE